MKDKSNWLGIAMIALPIIAIWILAGYNDDGHEWAMPAMGFAAMIFALSLGWIIYKVTE